MKNGLLVEEFVTLQHQRHLVVPREQERTLLVVLSSSRHGMHAHLDLRVLRALTHKVSLHLSATGPLDQHLPQVNVQRTLLAQDCDRTSARTGPAGRPLALERLVDGEFLLTARVGAVHTRDVCVRSHGLRIPQADRELEGRVVGE